MTRLEKIMNEIATGKADQWLADGSEPLDPKDFEDSSDTETEDEE